MKLHFSSSEPRTIGELISIHIQSLGVRQSSAKIYKRLLLCNREANSFYISSIDGGTWGNEYLLQSDKNSVCHGNIQFSLTFDWQRGQFLQSQWAWVFELIFT